MTDERPRSPRPPTNSIVVPLTGDGPLADDADRPTSSSDGTAPNWRKVVGIASLVGVALGVVTSVALLSFISHDDADGEGIAGDPSSTIDQVGLESLITTPPTLEPIPPPGGGDDVTVTSRRPSAPSREGPLLDLVVTPTYPPADGALDGSFDLEAAVSALGTDRPRRTTTHLELGVGGYQLDVTIVRDVDQDRYELTTDVGDAPVRWVVGDAGVEMYLDLSSDGDEQWIPVDGSDFAEFYGFDTAGALLDVLMRGPIRPDTIGSAISTAGDVVALDDGVSVARAFTVEIPGVLIPEWQLYLLGPTDEFLHSDRPSTMIYTVYVDDHDEIRRIVGLSDVGGIPQLIVHDIESLVDPISIELPDPATINTGPPRPPA